jgi:protein phosphatase
VLADGMGGYNAGEVASAMAVERIGGELGQWLDQAGAAAPPGEIIRAMQTCVAHANHAIFEAACAKAACAGMGTTLVVAVLRGPALVIGHIGDSRAYRLRHGAFAQLTRDHSLLQEQLDLGLLSEEEAPYAASRGLLTRALGVEETVLLDVQTQSVTPGDVYLLCSDGLTDMLSETALAAALAAEAPLPERAQSLLDQANAAGGRDNISLVLCQIPEKPENAAEPEKVAKV